MVRRLGRASQRKDEVGNLVVGPNLDAANARHHLGRILELVLVETLTEGEDRPTIARFEGRPRQRLPHWIERSHGLQELGAQRVQLHTVGDATNDGGRADHLMRYYRETQPQP